jgi:uncharacterized protein
MTAPSLSPAPPPAHVPEKWTPVFRTGHAQIKELPPASLYFGTVMHARLKPMGHRFTYQVMNALIDIGRLADADRISRLFRVNRRGIFSFYERDHGPRDGSSLRAHVEQLLRARDVELDGGRILLLCYPRLFGYVFNPLSVYYCYDAGGALAALIYEVRNTVGGIHSYVLPVGAAEASEAGIRQTQDKTFYVSPFIGMAMRYHFRMLPPGESVKVRILETDADGPLLAATFSGRRHGLTTGELVAALLRLPFVTLKVMGAIHFEALRLWLKGARLHPPPRPHPARTAGPAELRGDKPVGAVTTAFSGSSH